MSVAYAVVTGYEPEVLPPLYEPEPDHPFYYAELTSQYQPEAINERTDYMPEAMPNTYLVVGALATAITEPTNKYPIGHDEYDAWEHPESYEGKSREQVRRTARQQAVLPFGGPICDQDSIFGETLSQLQSDGLGMMHYALFMAEHALDMMGDDFDIAVAIYVARRFEWCADELAELVKMQKPRLRLVQ